MMHRKCEDDDIDRCPCFFEDRAKALEEVKDKLFAHRQYHFNEPFVWWHDIEEVLKSKGEENK